MQANANKYLGISVEDLFRKASGDPHSLTYTECRLIRDNFRIIGILDQGDRFSWRRKRPDLYTKRNQAREAVLTSTELHAIQAVDELFYQKQEEAFEANEEKRQQKPPPHMPREWVQKIIDRTDDKSWGYVFYYPKGMAGWGALMEIFKGVFEMPLYFNGYEDIHDFKFAQFIPIEIEEAEIGYLKQEFLCRRDRGDLKPGVMKNVFFFITDEDRLSCGTYGPDMFYGHLLAIDPDWSSSRPDEDDDGYNGQLEIDIAAIFYRFYEFMSTGYSLKDIWRDFHYVKSNKLYPASWGKLHAWCFTQLDRPYN
ncbi:hypothetical protein N7504_001867 [Penicillium tannophilum]|nr:hypothetical protein N7504_001867 [Penicillium tannophilum]